MQRRQEPARPLLRLAATQSGVVSRRQALDAGLSRHVVSRLLRDGVWQTVGTGVYATHSGKVPWPGFVRAGLLLGGPSARAAGLTAATLHGLTDEQDLPVRMFIAADERRQNDTWVTFTREEAGVRLPSTAAIPARTRVEDTVLDLCADADEAAVVAWVTTAVQRRLTSPPRLQDAITRRKRIPHRKLILAVVGATDVGVHSTLEYRYFTDVESAHGLPPARRQVRVGSGFADAGYARVRTPDRARRGPLARSGQ